jgi:uncharacterized protein (TIGR00299 family) protein
MKGLHLHIDGASGAAGDMMLGALLDLGVDRALFDEAFDRIGLGRERLQVRKVVKHGLTATDVTIAVGLDLAHEHEHEHEHDHTRHADIVKRLEAAGLDPDVLARALDIFARLARAEAKLHGVPIAHVAFHEVGAIDSIADVVGAAVGLAALAPVQVTATAVAMGHGTVRSAHGVLPVPSPAALEILREAGALITDGGVPRELCTPTGAAILAHAVTAWGPMPAMTPIAVGLGAGDMDLPDRPNVLRLALGRPGESGAMVRVEANIDDMSAELCEHAAAAITAAGAVDVWWIPIVMKKSRPALLLQALAPAGALDAVLRAVLTETTTIGVRHDLVDRRVLDREQVVVDTRYGQLPVKVARLDGLVVNAAPEYEACRAAAIARGANLKDVFAAAIAAWDSTRS